MVWRWQKVVVQVKKKRKEEGLKSKGTFTDGFERELEMRMGNQVAKCVQTPTILCIFFTHPQRKCMTTMWTDEERRQFTQHPHSTGKNLTGVTLQCGLPKSRSKMLYEIQHANRLLFSISDFIISPKHKYDPSNYSIYVNILFDKNEFELVFVCSGIFGRCAATSGKYKNENELNYMFTIDFT